jgi:hypothetical protein
LQRDGDLRQAPQLGQDVLVAGRGGGHGEEREEVLTRLDVISETHSFGATESDSDGLINGADQPTGDADLHSRGGSHLRVELEVLGGKFLKRLLEERQDALNGLVFEMEMSSQLRGLCQGHHASPEAIVDQ